MNLDAALVLQYLRQEGVGRLPATIARRLDLPRERIDGALTLLIAVGKVERAPHGAVHAVREVTT